MERHQAADVTTVAQIGNYDVRLHDYAYECGSEECATLAVIS